MSDILLTEQTSASATPAAGRVVIYPKDDGYLYFKNDTGIETRINPQTVATAAAWTAANPTIAAGVFGVESDTMKFKIGDGTTAWNDLAYWRYTAEHITIATTGGNTTLSIPQSRASSMEVTGALISNVTITVPNVMALFVAENNTTGAYTVTFKTAAGGGIVVPQASHIPLYADGTDVENPVATLVGSDLTLARIAGSTYSTIQHWRNNMASAGIVSGGVITDAGGATINVTTGSCAIRSSASHTATLYFADFPANNGIAIPANTIRYVGIEYNAGAPIVAIRATDDFDYMTNFPIGVVTNEAGVLHIHSADRHDVSDSASHIAERLEHTDSFARDESLGGLIIGETGTRNITMSSGAVWQKLTKLTISAFNSSTGDNFDIYYRDGAGGFTKVSAATQWPNTQYDNGTGTLATLATNKYGVLWFYLEPDDSDIIMVYGRVEHGSVAAAEAEAPPATLPNRVIAGTRILGKLVFQESDTVASSISSVFTTSFSTTGTSDHANLANLDYASSGHTGFATAAQGSLAASALQPSAIGSTVQAYDADLSTWAGVTPAAGVATFLVTPTSANLAAALTTETGTGVVVFSNSPTFTGTPMSYGAGAINTNTAFGVGVLTSNTTGSNNTAYGKEALTANTTGAQNTADGAYALWSNTTGYQNVATGYQSLYLNTTGNQNTAYGFQTLLANTAGYQNVAIGFIALKSTTTGYNNVACGANALTANTTGNNNTATGTNALAANITGTWNTAFGSYALAASTGQYNTAVGVLALGVNTTASGNTAIGTESLSSNTTASGNTAVGYQSVYSNTTGYNNVALGSQALWGNTTGAQSVAIGFQSLYDNTTGNNNVSVGFQALSNNTTASGSVAVGFESLFSNTTGSHNVATGFQSLRLNTTGTDNTAMGDVALTANTTGIMNVAAGSGALWSNTTGNYNTAVGTNSLLLNTTGTENVAVGRDALSSSMTGTLNTAVGDSALYSLGTITTAGSFVVGISYTIQTTGTTDFTLIGAANSNPGTVFTATGVGTGTGVASSNVSYNTACGINALFANTVGDGNTAVGGVTLIANTTGKWNDAFGITSLYANTTGKYNSGLGSETLYANTTGSYNTALGHSALAGCTTGSGNIQLGAWSTDGYTPVFSLTTENNRIIAGSSSVTNAYIKVAWTVVSDARDKMNFAAVPHGLSFIEQLNPISYQFQTERGSNIPNGSIRYGFKAQDILALEGANPVIIDADDPEKLRYNGESLVPILVKAIQELKAEFDSYKSTHP